MTTEIKFNLEDRIDLIEKNIIKTIEQVGWLREQLVNLEDGLDKCYDYIERMRCEGKL